MKFDYSPKTLYVFGCIWQKMIILVSYKNIYLYMVTRDTTITRFQYQKAFVGESSDVRHKK